MTRHGLLRSSGAALIIAMVAAHAGSAGAQTTELVSKDSGGAPGNHFSALTFVDRAISADGRYVAFQSFASNLVAGDSNNTSDVFVHDHDTGETSLVSVAIRTSRDESIRSQWIVWVSTRSGG